jgi:hypothetical protein
MNTVNDILQQCLKLAPENRASLARQLLLSLERDTVDPDAEDLWAAEIEARLARAPARNSVGGDWREAVDRIRGSLRHH